MTTTQPAKRVIRQEAPAMAPAAGTGDLSAGWPLAMQRLITWLEFASDRVPAAPFHFRPGHFVRDPALFLEMLRLDISRGPDGPRARLGALQQDLRQLRSLFGRRRPPVIPHEIPTAKTPRKPR